MSDEVFYIYDFRGGGLLKENLFKNKKNIKEIVDEYKNKGYEIFDIKTTDGRIISFDFNECTVNFLEMGLRIYYSLGNTYVKYKDIENIRV